MTRFFNTPPWLAVTAGLLLTLGLSSCVTLEEKRAMEQDLGALQAQLEVLRKRVDSRGEQDESTEHSQKTMADLKATNDQLREEIARINSQLDSSHHFVEQEKQSSRKTSDDLDLRFRDLENKVTELEKRLENVQRARVEATPVPRKADVAKAEPKAEPKPEPKAEPKSDKDEYEEITKALRSQGVGKIDDGEQEKTETELRAFLKKYPQTKYKSATHFWLGELHYARKDYKRAILEYDAVVAADSKSTKAPAARLKQGYCFLAMKESDKAKLFFQEVIARYPKTKEAASAKAKLEETKAL